MVGLEGEEEEEGDGDEDEDVRKGLRVGRRRKMFEDEVE